MSGGTVETLPKPKLEDYPLPDLMRIRDTLISEIEKITLNPYRSHSDFEEGFLSGMRAKLDKVKAEIMRQVDDL